MITSTIETEYEESLDTAADGLASGVLLSGVPVADKATLKSLFRAALYSGFRLGLNLAQTQALKPYNAEQVNQFAYECVHGVWTEDEIVKRIAFYMAQAREEGKVPQS